MRTVLYGDVLFLVNAATDLIVLCLCGKFLDLPRKAFRLIAASLFGGLYGVAILLPAFSPIGAIAAHLVAAILLCRIAYGGLGCRRFFRLYVSFFLASVLLGGAVDALYNLLGRLIGPASLSVGAAFSGEKAALFLVYAAAGGAAVLLGSRVFRRASREKTVMLEIQEGAARVTLRALVDSGNLLTDPFSGRPVILVRSALLLPLGLPPDEKARPEQARKTRVLIAHTAGGNRTMIGYLPDLILLFCENEPEEKRVLDALIAWDPEEKRDYAGYGAILPAGLAEG